MYTIGILIINVVISLMMVKLMMIILHEYASLLACLSIISAVVAANRNHLPPVATSSPHWAFPQPRTQISSRSNLPFKIKLKSTKVAEKRSFLLYKSKNIWNWVFQMQDLWNRYEFDFHNKGISVCFAGEFNLLVK